MTGLIPRATLAEALSDALTSMRDVPGVQGSFVVSDLGRLLARDMPALFGDDVLGEVGPRALRLRDTLNEGSDSLDSCVVRYPGTLLFLRPLRDGLLCALTVPEVNLSSLRMAMTLATRRLNVLLDGPLAASAPGPADLTRTNPGDVEPPRVSRTQEMPAQPPGAGEGTDGNLRFYRGAVIRDRRR